MKFWDSSAIVPLLVAEPSQGRLIAILEQDPVLYAWWGTPVECVSAIARREREASLSTNDASRALERLQALGHSWQEVLPTLQLRQTAQRLLRVHPLRAADALQLASAVTVAGNNREALGFVCLDTRLSIAAQREGFRVLGED